MPTPVSPLKYVKNANIIVVVMDGEPKTIDCSHPQFEALGKALSAQNWEEASRLVSMATTVEKVSEGKAVIREGVLYFGGEPVHNTLATKAIDLWKNGEPFEYLLMFLENLMQNPSKSCIDELYEWIDKGGLTLTDRGTFLAYKNIRADWKDQYTGTIQHRIGRYVEMDRAKVDPDRRNECSYGLHFCAHSYLRSYASAPVTIIVEVNPKDVVAIPRDYNHAKGRACRYLVVGEYTSSDKLQRDILSTKRVVKMADLESRSMKQLGEDVSLAKKTALDSRNPIRAARIAAGLTIAELAAAIGIHPSTLGGSETTAKPKQETVDRALAAIEKLKRKALAKNGIVLPEKKPVTKKAAKKVVKTAKSAPKATILKTKPVNPKRGDIYKDKDGIVRKHDGTKWRIVNKRM
jgi:ribosome-binding protein aMBF1 (putative translation factor)